MTGCFKEFYRVDIGSAHPALLPVLAFEGATKKTAPQLRVGSAVYARVSMACKDMEPELDCVNPTTGKADGLGELKEGNIIKVSTGLARRFVF